MAIGGTGDQHACTIIKGAGRPSTLWARLDREGAENRPSRFGQLFGVFGRGGVPRSTLSQGGYDRGPRTAQTLIAAAAMAARPHDLSACDIVGRDQGGFVRGKRKKAVQERDHRFRRAIASNGSAMFEKPDPRPTSTS